MHILARNNFHICMHTENEQEADRLFGALSAEGKIDMPLLNISTKNSEFLYVINLPFKRYII
ncbi:hypothetical protein D3C85_1310290 [compost metagenome]